MAARLRDMVSAVRFVDDYQPSEDDRLAANAPIRRMEEGLTDRLTPVQWKQLLLKIAIAYGESGQIREAREVLIKGQMRYPDYPLFYYNLACADALEKNVDGAIINLRMAWRNKANLPPDESLPDPLRDSSFSEMLKNRNVRNTVIEIMQGR